MTPALLKTAGRALVLAILAVGVTELLWLAGPLAGVEADLTDTWHDLRGERTDLAVPVVVVAVDDETLNRIPDPFVFWGPRFAEAFETLRANGTTAIGLDFLNKVSGEDFFRRNGMAELEIGRSWDAGFRRNLFQKDIVVVGSRTTRDGGDALDLPIDETLLMIGDARARVGLDNLPQDGDGTVRRWRPVVAAEYAEEPQAPILSLSLALAIHHVELSADAGSWGIAGRQISVDDARTRIVYRGPPGAWPRIPMWKLLEPGALSGDDKELLDGSVALIGATHSGSTDRLRSPFGQELMAGVEVHANALGTLLSGVRLYEPPVVVRMLLVGGIAWLAGLAFLLLEVRTGWVVFVLGAVAYPAAGYGAFAGLDVLLPTASLGMATGLVLTAAFAWRYLGEEREKRRVRRIFERYVSDAVVDDILDSPDGLRLGGERREMTVLFTDIRGFTTLSEALEPEEIVELLNAWFDQACAPVLDEGGVVDKFIGDAIMAVFGAPVHTADHADRAIRAALRISERADAFAERVQRRFGDRGLPPFDIGIGVHTGTAVVGNVGFEKRTEYTAIGDAVNVASRLEGLTKVLGYRVVVSQVTLDAATARYQTGERSAMKVKGREEPVQVVQVLGMEPT